MGTSPTSIKMDNGGEKRSKPIEIKNVVTVLAVKYS